MHTLDHQDHPPVQTEEERLVLLRYLLDHNRHHADELHEIAHDLSAEASALLHQAVVMYGEGNALLEQVINLQEEGKKCV